MNRFLTTPIVGPVQLWHLLLAYAGLFALGGAATLAGLVLWTMIHKNTTAPGSPAAARIAIEPTRKIDATPFDEPLRDGDLLIKVVQITSGSTGGEYLGRFATLEASFVQVEVTNTSKTKIVDWAGWHGKGEMVDEHDNRFEPRSTAGWTLDGPRADRATRINPGETYKTILYFQPLPPTSKRVTITLPLGGKQVKFSGRLGTREQMALEDHLAKGIVVDAADLLRDLERKSPTVSVDYPAGCAMKIVGTIKDTQGGSAPSILVGTGHNFAKCSVAKWIRDVGPGDPITLEGKFFAATPSVQQGKILYYTVILTECVPAK
jgi:hypothetical protein